MDVMWILQIIITVIVAALGFMLSSYYKSIESKLDKMIKLQIDNEIVKSKIADLLDSVKNHDERIKLIETVVIQFKKCLDNTKN